MKKITITIFALALSGCAGLPAPRIAETPTVKHASTSIPKAPTITQPASEAKPQTFKQRWFDRFMKHKTK